MNRSELIDSITASAELTHKQAAAMLESLVYQVTSTVRAGETVQITGFGSFKQRKRAARVARNPRTGEAIKTKASKGIGFTPSSSLKAELNAKRKPRS